MVPRIISQSGIYYGTQSAQSDTVKSSIQVRAACSIGHCEKCGEMVSVMAESAL